MLHWQTDNTKFRQDSARDVRRYAVAESADYTRQGDAHRAEDRCRVAGRGGRYGDGYLAFREDAGLLGHHGEERRDYQGTYHERGRCPLR